MIVDRVGRGKREAGGVDGTEHPTPDIQHPTNPASIERPMSLRGWEELIVDSGGVD